MRFGTIHKAFQESYKGCFPKEKGEAPPLISPTIILSRMAETVRVGHCCEMTISSKERSFSLVGRSENLLEGEKQPIENELN